MTAKQFMLNRCKTATENWHRMSYSNFLSLENLMNLKYHESADGYFTHLMVAISLELVNNN